MSLPIKTDANLHLQQERGQPDPIMLLAAAAAVIDDEGKYKKRAYERREIKLHGRHGKCIMCVFVRFVMCINVVIHLQVQ